MQHNSDDKKKYFVIYEKFGSLNFSQFGEITSKLKMEGE